MRALSAMPKNTRYSTHKPGGPVPVFCRDEATAIYRKRVFESTGKFNVTIEPGAAFPEFRVMLHRKADVNKN